MSEVRLIDANELKEVIINNFDNLQAYFPKDFIEEIDNAPTVAVDEEIERQREELYQSSKKLFDTARMLGVERPKGEWIGIKTSCDIGHKFYFCSVCSREIDLLDSEALEDYPFCHCGAEMRGEE